MSAMRPCRRQGTPGATLLALCGFFHFSSPKCLIGTLTHFFRPDQTSFLILYIPEALYNFAWTHPILSYPGSCVNLGFHKIEKFTFL